MRCSDKCFCQPGEKMKVGGRSVEFIYIGIKLGVFQE